MVLTKQPSLRDVFLQSNVYEYEFRPAQIKYCFNVDLNIWIFDAYITTLWITKDIHPIYKLMSSDIYEVLHFFLWIKYTTSQYMCWMFWLTFPSEPVWLHMTYLSDTPKSNSFRLFLNAPVDQAIVGCVVKGRDDDHLSPAHGRWKCYGCRRYTIDVTVAQIAWYDMGYSNMFSIIIAISIGPFHAHGELIFVWMQQFQQHFLITTSNAYFHRLRSFSTEVN